MKRLLVGGAGGTPSNNFIASLKQAPEPFYFIGMTSSKYDLAKAKTDERHLVPAARDESYPHVLKQIIAETRPDFLHAQHDFEIEVISELRDELGVRTFLPSKETVRACVDKYLSYVRWRAAGLTVPETIDVRSPGDLRRALDAFGEIWLRLRKGAFGHGALRTRSYDFAARWIEHFDGWGRFSAAECLDAQSVTWMSLWKAGELIVAQGRKRLYWEFANRTLSGVSGITGAGVTVSDPEVDRTALAAIEAIDPRPTGIFSVDLTYGKDGKLNPTEINIGRFFTTHNFFTAAGLNMPALFVKAAFDEPLPTIPKPLNPLPDGLAWIRGMDCEPVLIPLAVIDGWEAELKNRLQDLAPRA
jgi:carbamoyl-phosphate synthase large subunit